MHFNFSWLQLYAEAMGDVLWGDLWLTPRMFAYLAFLLAAGCAMSAWRSRRVYLRHEAHRPQGVHSLVRDAFATQDEHNLTEALRSDQINKLTAVLPWLVVAFAMLAAQANLLANAARSGRYVYWQGQNVLEYFPNSLAGAVYYSDLTFWLGVVAAGLAITWVTGRLSGDENGPHFKMRVIDWLAGLVDPIEPNAPTTRAQLVVARLARAAFLKDKMYS